jgi:hypothetical protein
MLRRFGYPSQRAQESLIYCLPDVHGGCTATGDALQMMSFTDCVPVDCVFTSILMQFHAITVTASLHQETFSLCID